MDVFFRGRVRDSSNCRGCLARRGLQRVPSRASRVCIKEGAGTANGSQESSKGGWNSFRPCPTSAGHADNKAPTALSRLVFFPSPPHFSNPPIPLGVEWKLENGSSVSGIPDSKFHGGGGGGGGHWQWRFTKGDGPTWVLSLRLSCGFPVFQQQKKKKKIFLLVEKKSSDYPSIRVPSSSSLSKSTRFSAINYFRHAEQPFGQSSFQN